MIKILLKYSVLLIIALFLMLFVYLTTPSTGLNIIVNKLNKWQPEHLHISRVTGALNRNIYINHIQYRSQGTNVSVNNINIHIQPLGLLLAEFRITHLHIGTVQISTTSHHKTTSPMQAPHWKLPLRLQLYDFTLQSLQLKHDNNKNDFNHIILSAYTKSDYIQVRHLFLTKKKNTLSLNGYVDLKPITLDLHIKVSQGDKTLTKTRITGIGSWQKLTLRNSMSLPVKMNNTLSLYKLFTQPSWKLTGHIDSSPLGTIDKRLESLQFNGYYSGYGSNNTASFSGQLKSDISTLASSVNIKLKSDNIKQQKISGNIKWKELNWPMNKASQY
jgi:hypothetical protein